MTLTSESPEVSELPSFEENNQVDDIPVCHAEPSTVRECPDNASAETFRDKLHSEERVAVLRCEIPEKIQELIGLLEILEVANHEAEREISKALGFQCKVNIWRATHTSWSPELTRPFAWRAPTPAELAQWKQQLHHKGLFCFGSNDVEDWDICVSAEVMELYKQPDAEVLATKHKWKVADLKDQDWRQLEDRMIDAGEDLQAYQDRKMCALQAVCGSADGG